MDKTVNIEVLLKAAEYIEQSNTGIFAFFLYNN